mmetsp:Transcript_53512/g.141900  ORF Transcript_53512/g.141900 Transcript_53512/m.141900 type:complete len:81 (+) Transcript_53512:462-704(+)
MNTKNGFSTRHPWLFVVFLRGDLPFSIRLMSKSSIAELYRTYRAAANRAENPKLMLMMETLTRQYQLKGRDNPLMKWWNG